MTTIQRTLHEAIVKRAAGLTQTPLLNAPAPTLQPLKPVTPPPSAPPAVPAPTPTLSLANPAAQPAQQPVKQPAPQPTPPPAAQTAPQPVPKPAQPSTPTLSVPNPTIAPPAATQQPAPAMQTLVSSPSASPPPPVTAPTTEAANTTIQPQPKPEPKPVAQPTGLSPEMDAKFNDPNVPAAEKQKLAQDLVQQQFNARPELKAGMADLYAGRDTPGAKAFQAEVDKAGNEWVQQEYARLRQENPGLPTQDHGSLLNTAMSNWQQMPEPMKWMAGIGLGGGLLSLFSGLFGEGGMGMGLLGILGLGGAGLAGAAGGLFGDEARKMVGQGAVGAANLFGAEIPKAEAVQAALSDTGGEANQRIQDAMNSEGGGWAAGQAEIDKSRASLDRLVGLGRHHGSTMLMGLPGAGAPRTAEEAGQMYDQLTAKHQQISNPQFLQNKAREIGLETLQTANKEHGGVFDAMLAARSAPKDWSTLPQRALNQYREDQIIAEIRKNPKLAPFLSKSPDGQNYVLPEGNTYEELMNNMLRARYGEYPGAEKGAANIAEKLAAEFRGMKLARCWAGYEPVPGAKKYSEGSCRPKGSKKTQKEVKNGKKRHTDKS